MPSSPLYQVEQPANIGTLRAGGMDIAGTSTEFLPRLTNGQRTFLYLCNDGSEDVYLMLGQQAVSGQGGFLSAGDKVIVEFPFVFNGEYNALTASGNTGHLCWIEGVL